MFFHLPLTFSILAQKFPCSCDYWLHFPYYHSPYHHSHRIVKCRKTGKISCKIYWVSNVSCFFGITCIFVRYIPNSRIITHLNFQFYTYVSDMRTRKNQFIGSSWDEKYILDFGPHNCTLAHLIQRPSGRACQDLLFELLHKRFGQTVPKLWVFPTLIPLYRVHQKKFCNKMLNNFWTVWRKNAVLFLSTSALWPRVK